MRVFLPVASPPNCPRDPHASADVFIALLSSSSSRSVQLDPSKELAFARPTVAPEHVKAGTAIEKETLRIKNPGAAPVAFKVKTTAPRSYCVRPNAGRIEPGQTVDVQVLVQAVKEAPPPGAKCKDKFLVQSVVIGADRECLPLPELWSKTEREAKGSIFEQKIRCVWKSPGFETVEEGHSDLDAGEASRLTTAGDDKYATVRQVPQSHLTNGDVSSSSAVAPTPFHPTRELPDETPKVPSAAAIVTPPSPYAAPVPAGSDADRLAAAQAEIERLKRALAEAQAGSGLRQRNVGAGGEKKDGPGVATALAENPAEVGVPLQVVAGIALGVFIITYLFF